MVKLRNLLDDSAKARRHHKNLLNVQVTFLAWFAESMGFLIIFLGTFVLGHENNVVNFCMQTLTLVVYFNILPCVFLIKDSSELKIDILDSSWYDMSAGLVQALLSLYKFASKFRTSLIAPSKLYLLLSTLGLGRAAILAVPYMVIHAGMYKVCK